LIPSSAAVAVGALSTGHDTRQICDPAHVHHRHHKHSSSCVAFAESQHMRQDWSSITNYAACMIPIKQDGRAKLKFYKVYLLESPINHFAWIVSLSHVATLLSLRLEIYDSH